MVPFLGAFALAALLLAFGHASLVVVVASFGFGLSSALGGGSLAGVAGSLVLSLGALALAEVALRARAARRDPRWVSDVRTLAESRSVALDRIGGEAQTLAQTLGVGVAIPDTVVLTAELTDAWLRELRVARRGADPADALPPGALGPLSAFLRGCSGGKIVVRASFRGTDPAATYPGLFTSVGEVDPTTFHALATAVGRVVESADSAPVLDYRRRMRQVATLHRSVVLQRQVDADVAGVAQSRGLDGRADSVLIDFAKRRGPTMTVSYDLVDGTVMAVAPDTPLDATPSWMNRLAALVVALDGDLGGTVMVHFAVEGGRFWVQSVRRVQTEERTTWISAGGPLEALFPRLPRFVCETLGDGSVMVDGVNEALAGLAVATPAEVRFEEGVRYLNVDVLRRALGRLGAEVLFSEPVWRVLSLMRGRPRRAFATLPEVDADIAKSIDRLRSWQSRVLLPLAREHVALGLRRWLIEAAVGMLSDGATGEAVPRVHRRLRPLLKRRAAACSAEHERARRHLEASEPAVRQFAAQILARGATDWSGVFVGERHLYAGLDEMTRWAHAPAERDALGAAWDDEKLGFEARHLMETPERIVEPAPPDSMLSLADSALAVVGLTAGSAEGVAAAPTESRGQIPAGAIVVLPDGRPDFAWAVLSARAVVFTGGGALSPMAQLARELGIPTVMTVQRLPVTSLPIGRVVHVDGALGALEVRQ